MYVLWVSKKMKIKKKCRKLKQLRLEKSPSIRFLCTHMTVTSFSACFSLLSIYTTDFLPLCFLSSITCMALCFHTFLSLSFPLHLPFLCFSSLVLLEQTVAAEFFQRMLLGTAFLCWCLDDLGDLSGGGHCGLVS